MRLFALLCSSFQHQNVVVVGATGEAARPRLNATFWPHGGCYCGDRVRWDSAVLDHTAKRGPNIRK